LWCASQSGQCGERLCHFILVRFWLLFKLPHKVPFVADPDMSSIFLLAPSFKEAFDDLRCRNTSSLKGIYKKQMPTDRRSSLSQRLPAPKLTKGSPHLSILRHKVLVCQFIDRLQGLVVTTIPSIVDRTMTRPRVTKEGVPMSPERFFRQSKRFQDTWNRVVHAIFENESGWRFPSTGCEANSEYPRRRSFGWVAQLCARCPVDATQQRPRTNCSAC